MINLNELETTSLITLINEMSNTSKIIDEIDDKMYSNKLQPYEVEYYIDTLRQHESYYRFIEDEIIRRGWLNGNEEERKQFIPKSKK